MSENKIEKNLDNLMNSIFDRMDQESKEFFNEKKEELQKLLRINLVEDSSKFIISDYHSDFLYQFNEFEKGYLLTLFGDNNNIHFLLKNLEFVKNQFRDIIRKLETSICSEDKLNFIIGNLFKTLMNKDHIIKFGNDYYHPKKYFLNYEQIYNYFKAINSLYYGNNEKYLIELKNIFQNFQNSPQKN